MSKKKSATKPADSKPVTSDIDQVDEVLESESLADDAQTDGLAVAETGADADDETELETETEASAAEEATASDRDKASIVEVICQTGGALRGAQTFVGNMTDSEIHALSKTIARKDHRVRIIDSKGYLATMAKISTRLSDEQKASIEASETE